MKNISRAKTAKFLNVNLKKKKKNTSFPPSLKIVVSKAMKDGEQASSPKHQRRHYAKVENHW